jgi:hypothetical protein
MTLPSSSPRVTHPLFFPMFHRSGSRNRRRRRRLASERVWGGSRHELVIVTVIVHQEGVENKVGITVGTKGWVHRR